jgi:nitric oxide reductase activation protein
LYKKAQKEYGVEIKIVKPDFSYDILQTEIIFRDKYAGEIESMKKIFRRLHLENYGEKRDFQGQELDYPDYMQSELESKVTGIRGSSKYFNAEFKNQQRPVWAVLADITPSTEQNGILDQIRAGLFINGEALGITDWPIGLFGFSSNYLYLIKDFTDKYGPEISNKIIKLEREDMGGTYIAPHLRAVGSLLRRQKEYPKGITIITDGEDENIDDTKKALKEVYDQKMYPFLIVIGKEFEKYAKKLTEEIGQEHYSIISRDKVYQLPEEMFRLFKTFGIAR